MNNCGRKNEIKKRKEIKRKEIEYITRVYNAAMDDFVIIIIIIIIIIINRTRSFCYNLLVKKVKRSS